MGWAAKRLTTGGRDWISGDELGMRRGSANPPAKAYSGDGGTLPEVITFGGNEMNGAGAAKDAEAALDVNDAYGATGAAGATGSTGAPLIKEAKEDKDANCARDGEPIGVAVPMKDGNTLGERKWPLGVSALANRAAPSW